jgi:CRP-like cAMP-binding protein
MEQQLSGDRARRASHRDDSTAPPPTPCGSTQDLQRCIVFQHMTPEELDPVFRRMEFEDFHAGEEILTEGLTYQCLWVIISGRCEVVKRSNGGRPNKLAVLEPGCVFGEMSFLDTAPHSASVRALSDVATMRLMHDAFEQLRVEHPAAADKIACNLVRILSDRLRRMDEWTCELVEHNGNERQHAEWHEFRAKLYSGLQL